MIATAPDRDTAWRGFTALVAPLAGPDLSYLFGGAGRRVSGTLAPSPPVLLVTPSLEAWRRAYLGDAELMAHDPVRLAVRDTLEPVDWRTLRWRSAASPAEGRFWRTMAEVGFPAGLSLPLHDPISGLFGCLSIHRRHDAVGRPTPDGAVPPGLHVAALLFHGSVHARFTAADEHAVELSRREQEVLHHVASGLISKAIARRMGLSPYTVDMHIGQAMRKLGARTRSEAASLAVQRRITA
jgi:DNA-binding CsgD family transcriptional regulator